jgi:hypothetical protein
MCGRTVQEREIVLEVPGDAAVSDDTERVVPGDGTCRMDQVLLTNVHAGLKARTTKMFRTNEVAVRTESAPCPNATLTAPF